MCSFTQQVIIEHLLCQAVPSPWGCHYEQTDKIPCLQGPFVLMGKRDIKQVKYIICHKFNGYEFSGEKWSKEGRQGLLAGRTTV